jgi:hypothetical protein
MRKHGDLSRIIDGWVMWHEGENAWLPCNGQNGTPDLIDRPSDLTRFVLADDSDAAHDEGRKDGT